MTNHQPLAETPASNPLDVQVTYAPDGTLVYLDGTPAPPPGPWKVCENTLFLRQPEHPRRRTLHERAVALRRKRKRGGHK